MEQATRRDVNRTDETLPGGVTLRVWTEKGHAFRFDLFNGSGWKVGQYKTRSGAERRATKLAAA